MTKRRRPARPASSPAMYGRSAKPLTGRYLSLAEREELAILSAQGAGVREIARLKLPRFRGVLRDLVQVGSAMAASLAAS